MKGREREGKTDDGEGKEGREESEGCVPSELKS
jgi:hypothetical protein